MWSVYLQCAVCHLAHLPLHICLFQGHPNSFIFLTSFFHIRTLSHIFYFFLVKNQLLVFFL